MPSPIEKPQNAAGFALCSAAEQCPSRFDDKCQHVQTKYWAELQNHEEPKGTIRGKAVIRCEDDC